MPFTPDAPPAAERRKAVIIQRTDGSYKVDATRTFATGSTEAYKLDLTGTATDLDSALMAVQNFMKTGFFQ